MPQRRLLTDGVFFLHVAMLKHRYDHLRFTAAPAFYCAALKSVGPVVGHTERQ